MYWVNSPRLRPLHVAFARLRLFLVLAAMVPFLYFAEGVPMWPAIVLVAVGELLQLWAAANLSKCTDQAAALVWTGPYAWVRNPMYLGRFLVGLGLCLLLSFRWGIVPVYVVAYVVYVHARVLREEERLRGYLGQPYVEYCQRVGRWMPRRLPRMREYLCWSWEDVARNHQFRTTGALVIVMLLVLARRHFL